MLDTQQTCFAFLLHWDFLVWCTQITIERLKTLTARSIACVIGEYFPYATVNTKPIARATPSRRKERLVIERTNGTDRESYYRKLWIGDGIKNAAYFLAYIEQTGLDGRQTKSILDAASTWSDRLRSEAETADVLGVLVERVELRHDGMRLSIRLPIGPSEKLAGRGPAHLVLTRQIPMQLRRRGVEMKVVIDPGSPP
jgi:hypothetical protein